MSIDTFGRVRSDLLRVAIFTDNDFEKINGVTTTLQAVLRFATIGALPRVYTATDVGLDTASYFAARSIGVGLPWYRDMRVYWPRWRVFAGELRRRGVQVIHTTTPGPVGLAARTLALRLGLPLVGSYHTELGEYVHRLSGSAALGRVMERYLRWYYRAASPLLVPSEATRKRLASRGYGADRLRVWGRGVDVDQFSPSRASTARRYVWRVGDRRPAILYAGRLSREKDLALVGPIREALVRRGLAHRFVFAGDGPMRRELQALCPDGVFLGALSHDDVAVAMASADLLFFPSATDTLGNVVLEAQAAGLPVIVSDRGGPHQHMVPGETGELCRAGQVAEFTHAIAGLLTSRERRRQMGRRARTYAERHSWPDSMKPLLDAWWTASRRADEIPWDARLPGGHLALAGGVR